MNDLQRIVTTTWKQCVKLDWLPAPQKTNQIYRKNCMSSIIPVTKYLLKVIYRGMRKIPKDVVLVSLLMILNEYLLIFSKGLFC